MRSPSRPVSTFGLITLIAATVAVVFLTLPLVAIFLRTSPSVLVGRLGDPVARDAIVVTLVANAIAQALVILVGTPAAYFMATRRFRGRTLLMSAMDLPLVLPPAVAGIALIATFGHHGLLGGPLHSAGIGVALTRAAVVMAVAYVSSPFYLRQAVAFEAVDPAMVEASETLGASPARTFRRIVVPLAAPGLGAGAVLSFARGMGEFGATIMFAGSLQGVTQTLPLAIYAQLADDFDLALALGALLVVVSGAILLISRMLVSWTASTSISHSRAATPGSR